MLFTQDTTSIIWVARKQRAKAVGRMMIAIFNWAVSPLKRRAKEGPDQCRTAAELRQYATKIQDTQPSFAQDLFAAANHADAE